MTVAEPLDQAPAPFRESQPPEPEVKFVRWPAESAKRARYQTTGTPRILVVEGGASPPICLDPLEDWIRPPLPKEELRARLRTLLLRSQPSTGEPVLQDDEILWYGDKSVALSSLEALLMGALIEHFRGVTSRKELMECGWPGTRPPGRNALDLHILRLRRRVEPLRLGIRTVWGRGYMLDHDLAGADRT